MLSFALLLVSICVSRAFGTTHQVNATVANLWSPSNLSISTGDSVLWSWAGRNHNVMQIDTLGDCTSTSAFQTFGTATAASGAYTFTFTAAGTYNFKCGVHCNGVTTMMMGQIVVTGPTVTGTTAVGTTAAGTTAVQPAVSTAAAASTAAAPAASTAAPVAATTAAPPTPVQTITVASGNLWTPSTVVVAPGQTVRWQWTSGVHNLIASDSSVCTASSSFASFGNPTAASSGDYYYTFPASITTETTFYYYCGVHCPSGNMRGSVTVRPSTTTATTTAAADSASGVVRVAGVLVAALTLLALLF